MVPELDNTGHIVITYISHSGLRVIAVIETNQVLILMEFTFCLGGREYKPYATSVRESQMNAKITWAG